MMILWVCVILVWNEIICKIKKLGELPAREEYATCLKNKFREYAQNKLEVLTNIIP